MTQENILVVRYGALGDMIYCFQSYHEIRQAHPNAKITLLTAPAFASFANRMPWFDDVMIDVHPSKLRIDQWLVQALAIHKLKPTRVYELHGKLRQTVMYWLQGGPFAKWLGGPEWSGAAPWCKFPRLWPPQPGMHFEDFLAAQLRLAGVKEQPPANLDWLDASVNIFKLPTRYAVIIPGCTAGQNYKRWPAENYTDIAKHLLEQTVPVLAVGTKADADAIAPIKALVPEIRDLSGQTDLFQLAGILRHAAVVIGNDTGPMHMAAALQAPTLALLSGRTNPVWSAPRQPKAQWLQADQLKDLPTEKVFLALQSMLAHNSN